MEELFFRFLLSLDKNHGTLTTEKFSRALQRLLSDIKALKAKADNDYIIKQMSGMADLEEWGKEKLREV